MTQCRRNSNRYSRCPKAAPRLRQGRWPHPLRARQDKPVGSPSLQWTATPSMGRSFHRRARLGPPVSSMFHRGQPNASARTAPALKQKMWSGKYLWYGEVFLQAQTKKRFTPQSRSQSSDARLSRELGRFCSKCYQFRSASEKTAPPSVIIIIIQSLHGLHKAILTHWFRRFAQLLRCRAKMCFVTSVIV